MAGQVADKVESWLFHVAAQQEVSLQNLPFLPEPWSGLLGGALKQHCECLANVPCPQHFSRCPGQRGRVACGLNCWGSLCAEPAPGSQLKPRPSHQP